LEEEVWSRDIEDPNCWVGLEHSIDRSRRDEPVVLAAEVQDWQGQRSELAANVDGESLLGAMRHDTGIDH
jgi:hypothetical protein